MFRIGFDSESFLIALKVKPLIAIPIAVLLIVWVVWRIHRAIRQKRERPLGWALVRLGIHVVLMLLVLGLGGAGMMMLASFRKAPRQRDRIYQGPLVEVIEVERGDHAVTVYGEGTVEPKIQVQLVPQVSGKVVAVHEALLSGGYVRADETLVEIEASDYELAVRQRQAAVAQAATHLQTQAAEAEVSHAEWRQMHPGEEIPPLVARQPQLKEAQARLAAAEADLDRAKLNLARTKLSLPFDGRVVSENVDVGQFVGVGQMLAVVYGTEVMEVAVPLEDRHLAWLDLREGNGHTQTVAAEIVASFAGQEHRWPATITRTQGRVDQRSRMVYVVAEARNAHQADSAVPLAPGMFVSVEIRGRTMDDVVVLPRYALRDDDTVWVARAGRLHILSVDIVRRDGGTVCVRGDLDDGAAVVVSSVDAVTNGMKVRTEADEDLTMPAAPEESVADEQADDIDRVAEGG